MSTPEADHQAGDGHDHTSEKAGADPHAHGGVFGPNTEVIFALASGAALTLGFGLEKLAPGVPAWLPLTLYVVAYGFGGFFTVREAFENLRNKRFE
ncbi:MAG TPA: heavy metal translocating P-type ATPase, partial [Brevundimonas sp.]|nr:heavy metal translocating P-type ATPase [Brevundimonas sp.]